MINKISQTGIIGLGIFLSYNLLKKIPRILLKNKSKNYDDDLLDLYEIKEFYSIKDELFEEKLIELKKIINFKLKKKDEILNSDLEKLIDISFIIFQNYYDIKFLDDKKELIKLISNPKKFSKILDENYDDNCNYYLLLINKLIKCMKLNNNNLIINIEFLKEKIENKVSFYQIDKLIFKMNEINEILKIEIFKFFEEISKFYDLKIFHENPDYAKYIKFMFLIYLVLKKFNLSIFDLNKKSNEPDFIMAKNEFSNFLKIEFKIN